ncbi:MAG: NAD(P)-dependent dehydrogenase (short-subunit alcohol dehydrogenase family) [Cocleimonas sp.]|jgi:NAD(P)-dependent dehydrogenase (short-subunit alcohol dehydrogenase family)
MPTLLITGANRGLGLELCKQFLQSDWKVIATCRNPESATRLSVLKDKYPELLSVHVLEVSNGDHINELKTQLGETLIDILFNNAGVYAAESAEFGSTDPVVWLDAFNVNVISPMKMMEVFVENVANSDKKIMANMSSKMGSITEASTDGSIAYRSTKSALNMVIARVALDLKEKGIITLALHPGWVRTDMGGANADLSTEESATSLIKIMNNASSKDTGKFFDIDGSIIPW